LIEGPGESVRERQDSRLHIPGRPTSSRTDSTLARRFSLVLLAGVALLFIACAGGGAGHSGPKRPPLRVGVAPTYPPDALARGIEGYAEVRFEVDLDGMVNAPAVVASEPATAP